MANKRWTCPQCDSGKLAPSRPRRDDTRRYCLPCSEKTGRLVERTCAALERQRGVAKERATRKRQAATERAKAKQRAKDPFDMTGWFKRLQGLAAFKHGQYPYGWTGARRGNRWQRVELELTGARGGGTAFGGYRITMGCGGGRVYNQLATLIHEMAHIVNDWRRGGGHDDGWRSIFGAAVQDLTGESMTPSPHRYGDDCDTVLKRWMEREHPELLLVQRPEVQAGKRRKPKTVMEWLEQQYPDKVSVVEREYREGRPAYEVCLKPGWCSENGTHLIVEYSADEIRDAMTRVEPCGCGECKEVSECQS
jgi:hypothetical protein